MVAIIARVFWDYCGTGFDDMAAQRVAVQLPQARQSKRVKKPMISRAKRSAGTPGWAGRRPPAIPTPCAEACAPAPQASAATLKWIDQRGMIASTPGMIPQA